MLFQNILYLNHLILSALNSLIREILLVHEPIILIPTNEKPDIFWSKHFVFVDFTQHFASSFCVEKSHNHSGVLKLQIFYHRLWVVFKYLSVYNLNVFLLCLLLKIIKSCQENFFRFLNNRDSGPFKFFKNLK